MPFLPRTLICFAIIMALTGKLQAQPVPQERLPLETLNVRAPSARITGAPGHMRIADRSCPQATHPPDRQLIVNTAVQEWAFFGYTRLDYTVEEQPEAADRNDGRQRWSLLDPQQAFRVADSIAGYWAAAPDSGWILQRQNQRWEALGYSARWRDPWSAAFISWVMCESGLGDPDHFSRAVAHHTYIDQAILARDGRADNSAYLAYDIGEQPVLPGDLLCRGSRPVYHSLDERRSHLGVGARTHCDIVVKVDHEIPAFQVIGGNVRGTVGLKLLPAASSDNDFLVPLPFARRQLFAHLKLQADPVALDALDLSPTIQATRCSAAQNSASLASGAGVDTFPSGRC